MNKNEVTKQLMKSKVMAKFNHYSKGNLYYTVVLMEGTYQFPISTVEEGPTFNDDESGLSMYETETVVLSADLGTTSFYNEMRGSELKRWVLKAIDSEEFIKVK